MNSLQLEGMDQSEKAVLKREVRVTDDGSMAVAAEGD